MTSLSCPKHYRFLANRREANRKESAFIAHEEMVIGSEILEDRQNCLTIWRYFIATQFRAFCLKSMRQAIWYEG
jgi:hypothetical protein